MAIHPTAMVEPGARLGDVQVGPYAVIEAGAVLADGVQIGPHSVIHGTTSLGEGTAVGAHSVLGGLPQDRKHDASVPTRLLIGQNNVFREFTSAHAGSSGGTLVTTIGDDNYFMANSHVAHDCVVGNNVMFANSAAIAGHVEVGDGAVLGGLCAVHQYTRIGRLAMLGGGAMAAQDVPPFTIAQGDRARLFGVNITGLKRAGFDVDVVRVLKEAWRMLFVRELPRRTAIGHVQEQFGDCPEAAELLAFLRSSKRGVCRAGVA
ncbi:MAG: acyl-ACP--UDP-N-acetylglucosamine O-acyltransferase [Rhodobacterales bacterium]|nr:acyl-ACP--UDP-N-acetylglucosamine O-acyltransferase [Rhodobacterales bacterium]